MGSTEKVEYEPPLEFEEVKIDPLLDISLSDSTELWLIHCPKIQASFLPDLDGQEVTLKLHHDRHLGSCVGSSGKSYDMVKTPTLNPDASVFLSSATGSKIVGKISRGVSLVHYPDPNELKQDDSFELKKKAQRAIESLSHHHNSSSTPSKIGSRSYKSSSSMHNSGRTKSSVSGFASGFKTPKKRHVGGGRGELERDHSGGGGGAVSGLALGFKNEKKRHAGEGGGGLERDHSDGGGGGGGGGGGSGKDLLQRMKKKKVKSEG